MHHISKIWISTLVWNTGKIGSCEILHPGLVPLAPLALNSVKRNQPKSFLVTGLPFMILLSNAKMKLKNKKDRMTTKYKTWLYIALKVKLQKAVLYFKRKSWGWKSMYLYHFYSHLFFNFIKKILIFYTDIIFIAL